MPTHLQTPPVVTIEQPGWALFVFCLAVVVAFWAVVLGVGWLVDKVRSRSG